MRIKATVAQLAVFLLALTGALLYTFNNPDFARGITGDSLRYTESGRLLLSWLEELSKGHFLNLQNQQFAQSREILLDGLVMPACAAVLENLGALLHCRPFLALLVGQAILAAVNALLVMRICRKLGFSHLLSACGGLAWGLYPSQIIACGGFMAEPLAVAVSLSMVLLLSALLPRGRADLGRNLNVKDLFSALVAGIAFILFVHLKFELAPAALALLFFTAVNLQPMRRTLTLIAFFATGAFITLTPWLIFSQATLNHCTLVPDHRVAHNLAIGLDLHTDGWGTMPADASVNLRQEDNALALVASAFKERPLKLGAMLARKIERLFKHNWNDFHCTALGFPPSAQILLHQMLLLGAGLGFVYLIVVERFLQNTISKITGSDLIKIAALLMVANHFIYLLFETQSRYGFTAMPWLLILTVIGLDHVEHTWHSRAVSASFILAMVLVIINRIELAPLAVRPCGDIYKATTLVNLLLAIAFAFWLSACCRAAAAKREGGSQTEGKLNAFVLLIFAFSLSGSFSFLQLEEVNAPPPAWVCQLRGNQTVEREIEMPPLILPQGAEIKVAMILIDGTASVEKSTLKLNGVTLSKPKSLLAAPGAEKVFKEIARAAGLPLSKIKHWRITSAPLSALNFTPGVNIISFTAPETGATIFGQYAAEGKANLPALSEISFAQYCFSGDLRPALLQLTEDYRGGRRTVTDLAPAAGEQNGNYRIFLLLGKNANENDLQNGLEAGAVVL